MPALIWVRYYLPRFSGVAWTWTGKAENSEIITSWESQLHTNQDMEKTPTALHYGSGSRRGTDITWGYDISEEKEPIRWFKLLIVDEEDLPADVRYSPHIAKARQQLKEENKTPTEAISIYLRNLWNHSINVITRTVSKSLVNFSRFHVVITLPAIWPQYARARMREAAGLAGILQRRMAGDTTLTFVSEPEAAALATLADMSGRRNIKVWPVSFAVGCVGAD